MIRTRRAQKTVFTGALVRETREGAFAPCADVVRWRRDSGLDVSRRWGMKECAARCETSARRSASDHEDARFFIEIGPVAAAVGRGSGGSVRSVPALRRAPLVGFGLTIIGAVRQRG